MRCLLLCVGIFAAVALTCGKVKFHPLSDEFINAINNKNTTWKAKRNFDVNTPISSLRKLVGVLPKKENADKLPLKIHLKDDVEIPETFDAREQWPDCADIIGTIRDQAACGSCWAFGAVEAMSDRICIHSNGKVKVLISAEDLMDCCTECGGCNGGWPDDAWSYWGKTGIVTGGLYGTEDGCKAYSIAPCEHHMEGELPECGPYQKTPECKTVCDKGVDIVYDEDLTTGSGYTITYNDVEQIQTEILTNGPVEGVYNVYEDFFSYSSGVYQHVEGDFVGGHAIKIIGWGVEDGTDYWLIVNSWNAEWGDHGYFKIKRGTSECGIEANVVAGLPNL
ncbi:hypothetical protein Zmor_007230 [Zophobas morio]|uniref:Peptidase C1A papain C-terminal domain-containing protein n=2 Tax=Zophobas morio TaxID=2755281 RepID=A0AA38MLZ8_9CUCU|nr:hypothetical protein Zmor_007230 [Zophobas morio]